MNQNEKKSEEIEEAIKEGTSEHYFVYEMLPKIRERLNDVLPKDSTWRGRGLVSKTNATVSFILDTKNPKGSSTIPVRVIMSGSYNISDSGEYDMFITSPYFQGDMDYHRKMEKDVETDVNNFMDDLKDLLEQYVDFLNTDMENTEESVNESTINNMINKIQEKEYTNAGNDFVDVLNKKIVARIADYGKKLLKKEK